MDRRGSLDQSLKDTLKRFSAEKRFAYWSGYVKSLAFHVAETGGSGCTSLTEYQLLISAWRMLLVVSTSHVSDSLNSRGKPGHKGKLWAFQRILILLPIRGADYHNTCRRPDVNVYELMLGLYTRKRGHHFTPFKSQTGFSQADIVNLTNSEIQQLFLDVLSGTRALVRMCILKTYCGFSHAVF